MTEHTNDDKKKREGEGGVFQREAKEDGEGGREGKREVTRRRGEVEVGGEEEGEEERMKREEGEKGPWGLFLEGWRDWEGPLHPCFTMIQLVHSVLPRYVPSHTKRISTHTNDGYDAPTTRPPHPPKPQERPQRAVSACQCIGTAISESILGVLTKNVGLPGLPGTYFQGFHGGHDGFRVGTFQHTNLPTGWSPTHTTDPEEGRHRNAKLTRQARMQTQGRLVIAATHHNDDARLDPEQRVTRGALYCAPLPFNR
ncbi:hypothetical protein V492_02926 [Pseudogymnoascus sp. VKM F-4246]|nr:hypothetical protein V492_02926 [Pseudogymnoascus sp. VKM F-4246]